jgi:hypothetical protein
MIQPNELRIGNWVNVTHVHFKETEIDTIKIDDLVRIFTNVPTYDYTPIPITEEWLLKLGFERTYLSEFRTKYTHKDTHCIGYDLPYILDKSDEGFTWYGRYVKDIKYIHQLQNLYFSLIGEELTLSVT